MVAEGDEFYAFVGVGGFKMSDSPPDSEFGIQVPIMPIIDIFIP